MKPDSLEELVLYKHHFTPRGRDNLDDYVDLDELIDEPDES